jgi:hypothetical protein
MQVDLQKEKKYHCVSRMIWTSNERKGIDFLDFDALITAVAHVGPVGPGCWFWGFLGTGGFRR